MTLERERIKTSDVIGVDVEAGRVFTAGDEIALGAGDSGSIVIENPSASGKTLVILGFTVYQSTTTSLDVEFFKDPTVAGGTVLTPINHNFASVATSDMVVTAGEGIISGGTKLHADVRVVRDDGFTYAGPPFIVPAGTTLALRITAPGGLSGGADVSANVTYKEF